MKKILALILVAFMCFNLFACVSVPGGEKDPKTKEAGQTNAAEGMETETSETEEETDPARILDLEKKDFGGYQFRFLIRTSPRYALDSHEILANEPNGDAINDAVYRRNQLIEKEYNCEIVGEKTNSPSTDVRSTLLSGSYAADFLYDEARLLRSLAASNLLHDYGGSEYIHLDKAWYDKMLIDQMNMDAQKCFLAGDASILDDMAMYLIRVNFDYLKRVNPDIDLYEEVRQGTWTVDRMYELILSSAKDVNQNGKFELGTDWMGYAAPAQAAWAHVAAGGVTLSNRYVSGEIEIPDVPKPELKQAWATVQKLLSAPCRAVDDRRISSGNVVFTCEKVAALMDDDNSPFQLGVLPMPKLSEEQMAYVTTASFADLCTYAIPKSVDHIQTAKENGFASGTEQACYFFEVLSYYSMKMMTPAFYEKLYENQSLKTPADREMLLYAMQNCNCDPAVGYNFGGIDIFSGMDKNKTWDQMLDLYKKYLPSAKKALSSYRNYIADENF